MSSSSGMTNLQVAMDERASKGEARDIEMEAAVVGTRSHHRRAQSPHRYARQRCHRLSREDGGSLQDGLQLVEDLVGRSDENHSDDKAEHQSNTRPPARGRRDRRGECKATSLNINLKILKAIKDVLLIVGQHYEHSKNWIVTIQEKIEEAKPPEQPLLLEIEKYDDTTVQEKARQARGSHPCGRQGLLPAGHLDKVHQQVILTSAELQSFLAAQTQRIADEHEDREKTLQEATISLERKLAQQEQLEAAIATLRRGG